MEEEKVIYYMENRMWGFLFHFFIFTIGGLRHCKGVKPRIYIPYMKPKLTEFDEKIVRSLGYGDSEIYTTKDFPSDYNWKNIEINYEICDLLKDKYEFLFTLEGYPELESYRIEKCHGELGETWEGTFPFLKQLFEEKAGQVPLDETKYIYITRRGAEKVSLHGGKRVRSILNEEELVNTLRPYNFQSIQLERLPFLDKIRLFQSAKIILAPNTAALMFTIFCKKDACVIEMIPRYTVGQYKTHWDQTQYQVMCKTMEIPYIRFQNYTYVEDHLNGIICTDFLEQCIKTLILNGTT